MQCWEQKWSRLWFLSHSSCMSFWALLYYGDQAYEPIQCTHLGMWAKILTQWRPTACFDWCPFASMRSVADGVKASASMVVSPKHAQHATPYPLLGFSALVSPICGRRNCFFFLEFTVFVEHASQPRGHTERLLIALGWHASKSSPRTNGIGQRK